MIQCGFKGPPCQNDHGRLTAASGVHLETIRYYERIGLIRKPERTAGGHRSYKASDVGRLRFIREMEKVRSLLALQNGSEATVSGGQLLRCLERGLSSSRTLRGLRYAGIQGDLSGRVL